MKNTTAPPKTIEVQQPATTWIARVKTGLQMRDVGEKMVADALAERRAALKNDDLFFQECDNTFGWSRSTTYRHLDPKQMEAARLATQAARAVPTVGTDEPRPRPLDEIASDLSTMGLKKTEPVTITCSICSEIYPKRDFSKHVMKCPPEKVEPEAAEEAACALAPGKVEISASQMGKRGTPRFTVSWTESCGAESTQGDYATLEEAMTFCPCSMDPDTIERVVIRGVWVQNPIPRDMLGHAGGYRIDENGVKVPGSEMAPDLRPYTEDDEPESEPWPGPSKTIRDEDEDYRWTLRIKDAVLRIRSATGELRHLEACKAEFSRSQIARIQEAHRVLGATLLALKKGRP